MARPRSSGHAIAFIAITLLLDTIGFGLISPVMPKLLVQLTGQDVSHAAIQGGFLSFVYAAMQFVWAPVLGTSRTGSGDARCCSSASGRSVWTI